MKIATLAGAMVLTAALAAPALAEAGGYCARPYRAYYARPYYYGYAAPYPYYYGYRYPYFHRRAFVRPFYPYVQRPRFHVGVWF